MEVQTIFTTPLASFKCEEFVAPAREWFNQADFDIIGNKNVPENTFRTTLNQYGAPASGGANVSPLPDSPELEAFKANIELNAISFFAFCGYDVENYDFKVANIWANEMTSNSFHAGHNHTGYVISGCFYVDVPEGCGGIVFTGPLSRIDKVPRGVKNYTVFNSTTWGITPEQGTMYMWESFLIHEVPQAIFDGTRRSIAFDVTIKQKEVLK